jgi:predicted DNA-binding transcriptional regulator YafY
MMGQAYLETKHIHQKLMELGFDVSLRTVERDMKILPDIFPQHVYVNDISKPYGYKLPKGGRKLSGMSPEEAVCLQLAFDYLNPLLPNGSLDPIAPYLKEAEVILEMQQSSKMKNWKNKVLTLNEGFNLQPAIIKEGILSTIHKALWAGTTIKAAYTSKNKKKPSEYVLHPCGLVYRGRISYLVCSFDNDTDKFIYLPLQRFQSVEIGDEYSAHRDKNVRTVAKDLVGFRLKRDKIKIALKFSLYAGSHLYETPISDTQKISSTKDGFLLVEDTVNDDMELRFWIRAFGDEVEVIKPKSLRNEFTQLSKRIGRKYEKS